LREGFGVTVQIALREFCICPKTVVAPTSIAENPATVASRPPSLSVELATAVSTVWAASAPMVSFSWATICPSAASCP
jgi:hypothetical protein